MSVATINQKEYLKKYLSGGTSDKKKKKRKKPAQPGRVQIVDDDIDLNNMQPLDDGDYNLYELAEDAPQIAGIVDERPEEVKALELYRGSKWKIIQDEHGIEDIKVKERRVASRDEKSDRFREIDIMPPVSTSKSQGENSGNVQKKVKSEIGRDESARVHDEDSDASPPRRCRAASDSDESPPRSKGPRYPSNFNASKKTENFSNRRDEAPPSKRDSRDTRIRRKSVSDDSDVSPPRKQSSKSISNERARKKSRFNSDSDVSPPRARKNKEDPNGSLPKKTNVKSNVREVPCKKSRYDGDSDESPPRRARNKESSISPQRKPKPFRRKSRFEAISDESPPRKYPSKSDFDELEQRSKYQHNSDRPSRQDQKSSQSSAAKVFQRGRSDSDESPPRRKGGNNASVDKRLHANVSKHESDVVKERNSRKLEKQERTLEGKKAGLQDAKALRQENLEHQLKEKEVFAKMSDEVSGKNATTVLRDRATGKKRDLAREAAESAAEKEKEDKKKEKYYRWGKGLKQVENQESRLNEDLYEMSKPLARYADDKDLEKYLMEQEREGDPMQEYIRSQKLKKEKENPTQAGEVKKYPVYQGPQPPPNRFGIKPGYRWDGVDRSTGFEQKWFQEQNSRKALQDESYKWSTEDM